MFAIIILLMASAAIVSTDTKMDRSKQMDSLMTVKQKLIQKLVAIDCKIDSIKTIQIIERRDSNMDIIAKLSKTSKVRTEPIYQLKHYDFIRKGSTVHIIGAEREFFKIIHGDSVGYIEWHGVEMTDNMRNIIKLSRERYYRQKEEIENIEEQKKREFRDAISERIELYEINPAWIKVITANVRRGNNTTSEVIATLEKGTNIFIEEVKGDWLKIRYKSNTDPIKSYQSLEELDNSYVIGWIHNSSVSNQIVEMLSVAEKRRREYLRKHPNIQAEYRVAIEAGNIIIGMNKEMVIASIGMPKDINRTVMKNSIHEQWVYGRLRSTKYLYFENGRLTAYQD